MENHDKVKALQAAYAGALADMVLRVGREGVLDKVTADKKAELAQTAALRVKQMNVQKPEDVIVNTSALFGCANWTVTERDGGFSAEATQCMLCAIARRLGAPSPCRIYCLDPMEAMIRAADPSLDVRTEGTLYDGPSCRLEAARK